MILELDEARAKYPRRSFKQCEDPRHTAPYDDAVAVVETNYDVYAVCEDCLAAIKSEDSNEN